MRRGRGVDGDDERRRGTEALPAASVSVAVRLCGPLARAVVVTDQLPPLTVPLPTR